MHVLVVEDDSLLGDALQAGLRDRGFAVDWVRDGNAADTVLRAGDFAAVVLDLGLPGRSGLAVLRRLRARGQAVPVLVLIGREYVAQGTVDDALLIEAEALAIEAMRED